MEVTVNEQNYQLHTDCTIAQLLSAVLKTEPKGIAVAVNEAIISKTCWPSHLLRAGDQILLIKATQGG